MDVLIKASVLVGIIALGFLAKRARWVKASDFGVLSRIALRVTLPCALATSFDTFTIEPSLLLITLFASVVVLAQQVTAFTVMRHEGPKGQAFGIFNVGNYNIGLFAIPYVSTFVGPHAILVASLFDVGNALAAAGLGYGWGSGLASGRRRGHWVFLRTVFSNPVFVTYLFLLVLRLADLHLPAPVLAFTSTVGAANTFVAMFMIGVGLEVVLPRSKYRTAACLLGVRYAFTLVLVALTLTVLPIPHDVAVVIAMILCAPIAAMAVAFSDEAGLDVETSAFMTSVSVLIAIAAMPAIALAA